ncbi:OLC1v1005469C1 [Oldenlandia corymbosa var. corymbosa]|uniref:OLC1v1005469C1 n=1 Tax=Oldenlandia corymbosa var. corymbosa TaxID=529605 RepID=A0AAV1DES2_OLDCO|nr:OLC1v1005469C1 [Oldenlandia corymbosa var. corymbosa]
MKPKGELDLLSKDETSQLKKTQVGESLKVNKSMKKAISRQEEELSQLVATIEGGYTNQMISPAISDAVQMGEKRKLSDGCKSGQEQDRLESRVPTNNPRRQLSWGDKVELEGKQNAWAQSDGANPPIWVMEDYLKKIWGRRGVDKVIHLPSGLFVVRFNTLHAREEVLSVNMYQFGLKPLIVKPWNVEKGLSYRDVDKVPVWI